MSKVSPKSPRAPIKQKRSKPRRGPMRDAKYRKWVAHRMCSVHFLAPKPDDQCDYWTGDDSRTDAAHTQNNGASSKGPDSSCAPLCRKHHREYDAGREAFEAKYGVDMKQLAADNYAEYLSETEALVRKSD